MNSIVCGSDARDDVPLPHPSSESLVQLERRLEAKFGEQLAALQSKLDNATDESAVLVSFDDEGETKEGVETPKHCSGFPRNPSSSFSDEGLNDFQQITAYVCLSPDIPIRTRAGYMGVSVLLVVSQVVVLFTVGAGIVYPTCETNSECSAGYWCVLSAEQCFSCEADYSRFCETGASLSGFAFKKSDVELLCASCVDGTSGEFVSEGDVIIARMAKIRVGDAVSIALSFSIIAFALAKELRSIQICTTARLQFEKDASKATHMCWSRILACLETLRQYVSVPLLMVSVSNLIAYRGGGTWHAPRCSSFRIVSICHPSHVLLHVVLSRESPPLPSPLFVVCATRTCRRDALNVCMNSVALLFLLDMNELAFSQGLGEQARARHAARWPGNGIPRSEGELMERSRCANLCMVPVFTGVALTCLTFGSKVGWALLMFGFPMGGAFYEAYLGLLGDDKRRACAKVMGKILALHLVWALLMWMVWDEAILVEAVLVLVKSVF